MPSAIVAAARPPTSSGQAASSPGNAVTSTLTSAVIAAIFGTTDRKPAAGAVAPSSTSGIQKWSGTAAISKPNPTSTSASASPVHAGSAPGSAAPISARSRLPVRPYRKVSPYPMTASAAAPSSRNLSVASSARASPRTSAARR